MFGFAWRSERELHRSLVDLCPWFLRRDIAELAEAIGLPGSSLPARLFALRREGTQALLKRGGPDLEAWCAAMSRLKPAATDARRLRLWTFAATLDLTGLRLADGLDLGGVVLPADLLCLQTVFADIACLNAVRAPGRVDFSGAVFEAEGQFEHAVFMGPAIFAETRWAGAAQFRRSAFRSRASFLRARFEDDAWLRDAHFAAAACFAGASWSGEAGFGTARFGGAADFSSCVFLGNAGFDGCRFESDADFRKARFNGRAWFDQAHFEAGRNFMMARFSGRAVFDDVSAARPFSPVQDTIRDLQRRLAAS